MSDKTKIIMILLLITAAGIGLGCWVKQAKDEPEQSLSHAPVLMYYKPTCPYCIAAQKIFASRGIKITKIDVSNDPDIRNEMIERANGKTTVPQIFIDNQHVGGYDSLNKIIGDGTFDQMMNWTVSSKSSE